MIRAAATVICLAAGAGTAWADDWITKPSPHDAATTADRLEAAIEASPATLVARIDHAAAAREAGLEMPPATVMILGNPQLGTPLMLRDPRAAIDLPLRVLIWEEGGETTVGYLSPTVLAERHDLTGEDAVLDRIGAALDGLTDAAVTE